MATVCSVIVGISHFFLACCFFLLNGLLLVVLVINKEYSTGTYRIIKNLCVACMMQLAVFIGGAFMVMAQSTFHPALERILGSVIQASWIMYVGIQLALAVDRLLVFVPSLSTKWNVLPNVLLCLSWTLFFLCAVTFSLPFFGITLNNGGVYYLWSYSRSPGSQLMESVEPFYDIGIFSIVLAIYVAVVFHIGKLKTSLTTASFNIEIRILVAAIVTFLNEAVFIAWGFWGPKDFMDQSTLLILFSTSWLVECGTFVAQTLIINTLVSNKEFKTTTYRIIKNLCVSCMVQLFIQIVSSPMTIAQCIFHEGVEKVLGSVIQSFWFLYVGITLTLAVDRLVIFACPTSTKWCALPCLLLCLSWVLCLSTTVIFLLPGFGITHDDGGIYYFWNYDNDYGSDMIAYIEPFFDVSIFTVVLVIYTALMIYITKLKQSDKPQTAAFKTKVRIMVAAIVSFVFEVWFVVWGFWGPHMDGTTLFVLLNTAWIVDSGIFVTQTLAINVSLREKVIETIWMRKKVMIVSTINR
uniref:7TM_GPCR_Srx domain-containing protein n=1 Tax=Steinernema glaseri TaxID=37863 RepID=A0A1I7Z7W3_9BILA